MNALRRLRSRVLPGTLGVIAGAMILLLILVAVLGSSLFLDAAEQMNPAAAFAAPSATHLFGTDALGRDVFARVIIGTRVTLGLALLATTIGGILGILLGALAASLPARIGGLLSSSIAVLVAFPPLLLAIFFSVIAGLDTRGAVLAIAAAYLPGFARFTETLALSLMTREFIQAAQLLGVSRLKMIRSHVLPNIAEPIALYYTTHVGTAVLALAGLSFIGFGVQPPVYDLGSLLSTGIPRIYLTPLSALGPAAAIAFAGLAFNLVGEAFARRDRDRVPKPPRPEKKSLSPSAPAEAVLSVRDLTVHVPVGTGTAPAVRGLTFDVFPGEIVGIVGESGSGKSLAVSAAAANPPANVAVTVGRHELCGRDLAQLHGPEHESFLGENLAMIYQDPGSTFNPALRLRGQVTETARTHRGITKGAALSRAVELMRQVSLRDPEKLLSSYQHQLSGGMKQRLSIATSLMCDPPVLIADEPTSALDVTVQAGILDLLRTTRERFSTAILLVSHDLAVISEVCDRVIVMYAGIIVEEASVTELLERPAHPYTRALLATSLDLETELDRPLPMIAGTVPSPGDDVVGCRFAARCPLAVDRCRTTEPALEPVGDAHAAACWRSDEVLVGLTGEFTEVDRG